MQREMESKIDVDDDIVEDDWFDTEVEESSAPLRWTQVVGSTARERAEHDRIHLPYRSWCPVCVSGQGTNHCHKTFRDDLEE